jgi:ribosomal protein L13
MIGKRTSVIKMMPEANRRREVYNKLKIFETENNGEKNGK